MKCVEYESNPWGIIGGLLLIFFIIIPVGALLANIGLMYYFKLVIWRANCRDQRLQREPEGRQS